MRKTHRRARCTVRRLAGAHSVAALLAATSATAQDTTNRANDRHHEEIEEITVTANPLSRSVKELAQPTSVMSGDELTTRQSSSIGETVSGEPGVSSTYFGPVASRPVIRGQYGERVRVLSNSLDSLDASALSEDHQVSVEGILAERVEIIRGPATLLYGSGAAGGLVNVVDNRIIENSLQEPIQGALSLGLDSATGEESAAGRVAFGSERIGIHLDYFRRNTDDVEIPGFAESAILRAMEEEDHGEEEGEEEEARGVVENTDSETKGGAVGVSLTGDRGFLGIAVSAFNSNYGIPGHHHHEEEGEEEEKEEAVRVDLDQRRVDVRGEYTLDGPIQLAGIRLAHNDYEHVELEGSEVGTRFDTTGADARLELRHAEIGNLEGAFGLQYQRTDFEAVGEEAFVPSSDTRRTSVFAFEELPLGEDWTLQASARAERQTIDVGPAVAAGYTDTAFGGSIGAIRWFGEDTSLSANYSLTERHPNATELYANGPHVAVSRIERGSVVLGNGILDKETSSNLDLTLRSRNDRVEWSITGFINSVDDYVLLSPTGEEEDGLPVFDYGQTDVEFYGFEAESRIELLDSEAGHLHARLFSDFVYAEQDSGEYLPRLTPWRYGLGLHYTLDRWEAGIDTTFHDRQDKAAINELPTDDYVMVDAELSWSLDENGLFVFLKGTNLTDEDARKHSSPLKDTVPLPGRSVRVGVRYLF